MVEFRLPAESSGEIIAIDQFEAAPVRAGIAYWRRLSGTRRFPAKTEIVPRALGALLNNVILIRVLEDGADYEYRIVGDALVLGFNENFAGRRVSDIIASAPKFGLGLRLLYETVRTSGEPLGYRGRVGRDLKDAKFDSHENVLLPFGPGERAVDHLLVVSAIGPRARPG
jgi:hypothetical protein